MLTFHFNFYRSLASPKKSLAHQKCNKLIRGKNFVKRKFKENDFDACITKEPFRKQVIRDEKTIRKTGNCEKENNLTLKRKMKLGLDGLDAATKEIYNGFGTMLNIEGILLQEILRGSKVLYAALRFHERWIFRERLES